MIFLFIALIWCEFAINFYTKNIYEQSQPKIATQEDGIHHAQLSYTDSLLTFWKTKEEPKKTELHH